MKAKKYNRFLPITAVTILAATGHVTAATPVYSAENSSTSFADSKTSPSLSSAVATVSETQANALNQIFNDAITELNADDTMLGSAARYQKAANDLAADPTNVAKQAELDLAQTAYSNNITSVNNLKAAAKVVEGTSYKTFNGVAGQSLADLSLNPSDGAIKSAVDAATSAGDTINDAVDYYKAGAGATTVGSSKADLQGQVIDKLTPVTAAAAADVDANGFKLTDVTAFNTAGTELTAAQSAYTTAINDPTSTSAAIATAAGTLAAKEQAYTTAVSTLYANYSPITDTAKTALVETILNGSWERDAIKSNTETLATTTATAEATKAKVDNATTGLDATKVIADAAKTTADATKLKVDDATTGLDATKAIADAAKTTADATKLKVDHASTGLAATKKIADDEVLARTALIREENGQIHIGQNSLVTSEAGGFQELSAQDALGGSLDINVTNGSDLRVNGVSVATDTDVANEAAARTLADTLIRTDFAVADTNERNARIAADNSIRSDFAAADTAERNARIAADGNLRNDIDTNTRGIAMVAAMTNTTIQPGMTHGVDFNISQFESETGFAFGYAHRINENVQVHGSAASTTDFDESVGRLGVSYPW
jgi:hypothetical protein